ncbi:hypothetical protein H072_7869 [Dactylellina haptotyla CBS 200.50]|uniref:Nephrocystin 3-like N-terminal domain-containing protein n=1 Tax=Dactylellina haptotyla (strain CBS 200.50) TaxID=1284197 RepID=S8ABC3_DACHA|nr:hypothetical protein H072_7869 [Dactylellina haptotyla CBS 200.50]
MEVLSATASIIAVVQGIVGCWKIYSSVKDAREDISRLQAQVLSIQELTTRVEALVRGPDGQRLTGSDELKNALKGCNIELRQLRDRLDSGNRRSRKLLSVIKIHAKWPFTGPEVLKTVNNLERWKQSIALALNINQVAQLIHISQKLDFAGLPFAEGAAYGSYSDRHQPECLEETRVDLLRHISKWVEDPHGKCIFWLSGKAGTGKSTISRTVARNLGENGQLAASFFFRRGEKDRVDAAKFFTTVASQLANSIRDIAPSIQSAIDAEPRISSMGPREQFNKLIFEPLSQLRCSSNQKIDKIKAVVVIDALDECHHEEDERLIISQLGRLKEIQAVEMRVFLTSRPELPERLGFGELSDGTHQDVVLHKVPGIEHDIELFFDRQFSDIRRFHSLPDSWPATEDVQRLVKMAVPLFIFAATACRFIGDSKRDPEQRIKIVMEYQTDWRARKLEQTYFPVLHSLASDELSEPHDTLAADFKAIVGAILTLASPLSVPSLSGLLCIPEPAINRMLDQLHSVLDVPSQAQRNAPIRALHLSFRDFLFDESLRSDTKFHHFWIDDKESHRKLYSKCVELMSGSKGLKKDICGLRSPGTLRHEIKTSVIESGLSMELRYACRYWVYHLQQSGDCVNDGDMVHKFLQRHVLHWLEAMSLSDEIRETISIVGALSAKVDVSRILRDLLGFTDIS